MKGVSALIKNPRAPPISSLIQRLPLPSDRETVELLDTHIEPEVFQLKPKKLPPLPRTRDLLHVYGIRAKKNLSQNFLLNQRIIKGLVRAAGVTPGSRIIEVGPGPGNLTRAILEQSPLEVLAVEKDRRFLPLLEQLADSVLPGQLKILLGDALDHDFHNIFGDPKELTNAYRLPEDLPGYVYDFSREWEDRSVPPIRLIGNLPFSVSTPLLVKWLHHISLRNSFWQYGRVPMLLTFQDEVARRICANATAYERTRLSAMVQNYCHVEYIFRISGKSFTPLARVDTGVVRLEPKRKPVCEAPFKLFEKFVRHLYHHRSHDLGYNYRKLFPVDMQERAMDAFDKARVNPNIYPCMISNKEVGRLCDQYWSICREVPALVEYDYRASRKILEESTMKVLKDAKLGLLIEDD